LERPFRLGRKAGKNKIFLDIETAEDAPILVHELHAGQRDLVALPPGDVFAVEEHLATARPEHAHEALQSRALARAVASKKRDHLVPLHAQRHIEEDVRIPVVAVETADFEQAHASFLRAAGAGAGSLDGERFATAAAGDDSTASCTPPR